MKLHEDGTLEGTPQEIAEYHRSMIEKEKNVLCIIKLEIDEKLGHDPNEFEKLEMAHRIKHWDDYENNDNRILDAICKYQRNHKF